MKRHKLTRKDKIRMTEERVRAQVDAPIRGTKPTTNQAALATLQHSQETREQFEEMVTSRAESAMQHVNRTAERFITFLGIENVPDTRGDDPEESETNDDSQG
jgi:ribosomal protein S10